MNVKGEPPGTIDLDALVNGAMLSPEQLEHEKAAGELFQHWQIRNLRDAYKEREPLFFLIDGLLPCPSLSVVFGGPGSLKSMLLADMAMCVASGLPWLEPLPGESRNPGVTFQTKQAPVLWIDFDNGIRRTDERIDAIAKARNLPEETPFYYVSMPRPWLDISNLALTAELAKLIKHFGVKLVIIDNLGLVTGDVEENSAQMTKPMGNLRWLCEECECAIILVHHQRKSSVGGDNGIRKGETLRGHSSIEAALDLALRVDRKDGEDSVAISATKVRGYQAFTVFGAYFTYEHREGTHDLHSARFFAEAVETPEEQEIVRIKDAIRYELRQNGQMNQGDIVNAVRDSLAALPGGKAPGINKIRGIIKTMADAKELRESSGERKERVYGLI